MQPRSDQITSRSHDVDGRHVAAAPRSPGSLTSLHLSAVLTDLSATVSRIRALQQLNHGDDELQSRLRRTEAQLESLISDALHTDGSGSSPPPPPRSSPSTPRQRAAEQAFLVWLAEPTSADEVLLESAEGPEPLTRILGELSLSERALPAGTGAGIGLPGGATVGHAAAELLVAVKDPAGPRCRSFRAAVYYLREVDRNPFIESADAKVDR